MWKYFLLLAVLILAPLGGYLSWRSGLPTEREVLARHRGEVDARRAQIRRILDSLPPPGSVTSRTLTPRPNPVPVCDAATGECNLQIASSWMLEDPKKYADTLPGRGRFGPDSLSDMLLYDIAGTLAPHDRINEKVWGFAGRIETGMRSRYLLVNRYLQKPGAKGPETTGVEGFLIDLSAGKVVGAFRYPDWYHTSYESDDKYRFLTETLGGKVAPQFPAGKNVRNGDVEIVTAVFVGYEFLAGILLLASIPTAVMLKRQWRRLEEMKEAEEYPDVLVCPVCREWTESLKQYRMLRVGVFLVIVAIGHMETVTACPRCMRRHIFKRFATNLIPANLLMLFFGPAYVFLYLRTFHHGHSPGAVERPNEASTDRTVADD